MADQPIGTLFPEDRIDLPDYDWLGRLGGGGMGVVHRVFDPRLRRELALKTVRSEYAQSERVLQRFRLEVHVTAQLQHPGVVPVHADGVLPDGRPYYLMKVVEGQTLAKLLAERPHPTHNLAEFIRIFGQVCQPVAYAHSRRVIHRDLKPLNVMVGKFGEVQVMDWGVARKVGSTEEEAGSVGLLLDDLPGATRGAIGTYQYMPPEQVNNRTYEISPQTDVFALGAILCEILTGQPAYARQVQQSAAVGEVSEALDRLARCGAAPELVDLASQCLSKDRLARPADAGEVAQRVAAHRAAVEAKLKQAEIDRSAALVRAAEERKRRRVFVIAAVSVVSTLLAGGAVAAWQWWVADRARADLVVAQEQTTLTLKDAEAARDATLTALRSVTDRTGTFHAARSGRTTGADREYIRLLLIQWEAFAATRGDTPEATAFRAEGYARSAELQALLEALPEAETNYKAAITLRTSLAAQHPDVPRYRGEVAGSRNNYGMLLARLGRLAEAETELRESIRIRTRLAEEYPSGDYQADVAGGYTNLASILSQIAGRAKEVEDAYDEAVGLYRQSAGAKAVSRAALAKTLNNRANHRKLAGRPSLAEADYREASELYRALLRDSRQSAEYQTGLAQVLNNLANLLRQTRRMKEAEPFQTEAIQLQEQVTKEFPGVPAYWYSLAMYRGNYANLLAGTNQADKANAVYEQAVEVMRPLVVETPYIPDYGSELARTLMNWANNLEDGTQDREILSKLDEARRVLEPLVALHPKVLNHRLECARVYTSIGVVHIRVAINPEVDVEKRKKAAAAVEESHQKATALMTGLVADSPLPLYRSELAGTRINYGLFLAKTGRKEEAVKMYRAATDVLERLAKDSPTVTSYAMMLAECYGNVGQLHLDDQPAAAKEWYTKAVDTLAPILRDTPRSAVARRTLKEVIKNRALASMKMKQFTDALGDWDRLTPLLAPEERAFVTRQREACQKELDRQQPEKK